MIERSRGTGPRATVKEAAPDTVGRGPVPRHARENRALAMTGPRATMIERSRGTGPRATVKRGVLDSIERSRGTGPRATVREAVPNTVGRGPVPRHAPDNREIARDRPSRYGKTGRFGFHTRYGKINFFSQKNLEKNAKIH